MVSARRFAELGAPVLDDIPELNQIETTTRTLTLDFDGAETIGELAAGEDPEPKSKGTARG